MEELVGKKVVCIYDDKSKFPSKKEGILNSVDDITFTIDGEVLNKNRIIRMEEVKK